jgi:hypothetical protein
MQGSDNQVNEKTEVTNVVSLFGARSKAAELKADEKKDGEESFEEIQARNQKNKERLAKERNSANKSVLRSYRIKN